jgi:glycosyltransferase involved in cell wall biosynthesis
MVAYHFPPLAGSSGIQRTLRFVQHLPGMGWQPLVLSADPRAYETVRDDLLADIPADTVVRRAFALDTARHLQMRGRYLSWMARPDRWVSWKFAAIREGMRMIDEFKPDVIWSTYPIATAHLIASRLHERSGIPWIADFRDPMAHDGFPADPQVWQSFKAIEEVAIANARYCVFAAPGAARLYKSRYPQASDKIKVVENGFDEESFAGLSVKQEPESASQRKARPMVLLHSGIIYTSERDPTQLFQALGQAKANNVFGPADIRICFRASVNDGLLRDLAETNGALDFIELRPAVPYREALGEMLAVDALLVMQASNCNDQIPAKIYEYLRAGKPILCLTDPLGDTAGVLRNAGLATIARLDSAEEILSALVALLRDWRSGCAQLPAASAVTQLSRRSRSQAFAKILNQSIAAQSMRNLAVISMGSRLD